MDKNRREHGGLGSLTRKLGHRFSRPELLTEALTHRSAHQGQGGERFDYERLEFLGDRVLGLVIAETLHHKFAGHSEGQLARRFTELVRRDALVRVAKALELGRYLRMAESEDRSGGRETPGILADSCEAMIGAVFVDGGYDAARKVILRHWKSMLEEEDHSRRDSKSRLQEWAQARGLPLPRYRVVEEAGPSHEPSFTMEVLVKGVSAVRATASSKRKAEQAAAARLLKAVESETRPANAGEGGRHDGG